MLPSLFALVVGIQGLADYWTSWRWHLFFELGIFACCLQTLPITWSLFTLSLQCRRRPTHGAMAGSLAAFVVAQTALAMLILFHVLCEYLVPAGVVAGVVLSVALLGQSWRMACRAVYDFG
jgi:hypothetical protein